MATSVKLDDEMKDRVRALADTLDRSPHWVMRQAIREYVEREELRENFKQEAIEAWREYQENGLHITGEETREWLETWGTEDETDPPPCHE